jgi:hypothetical protein
VSLSLLLSIAGSFAPPSVTVPPDGVAPLERPRSATPSVLPPDGVMPLERHRPDDPSDLPPDGALPLEAPITPGPADPRMPPDGLAPFYDIEPPPGRPTPMPVMPLGVAPPRKPPPPPNWKTLRLVRLDLLFGPMWRIHRVDTMVATSAEFGRVHGFSAAFHTAFIVDTQREVVRALDVPIGFGAALRGRLRKHPLFASVGLTAGILVHRSKTEKGLIHRVDPDFRLPIRFAWTIANVGLSLVVEQGYSVRNRNYARRGVEVWARHAYRIGFAIGLHSDIMAGRATKRRPGRHRGR